MPYLVEVKGCGSPLGELGHYHLRRTTPKGCHFHMSGALGFAGALAEFSGLEDRRASAALAGYPLELRAVACGRYIHPAPREAEALGQVIRLCPSSLRASFRGNAALAPFTDADDRTVSLNLGRESACLLQFQAPRIHRNPSLNNLCYVAPGSYVLSDMEAAPSLSVGYEALDYEDSVIPDQYRHGSRSVACFDVLLEGMRSAPGDVREVLIDSTPKDEAELGRVLYAALVAPRVVRSRLEGDGSPRSTIEKNFDHMRVFMPDSFFRVAWREWLADHLTPLFKQKLAISDLYCEIAGLHGWANLATSLSPSTVLSGSRAGLESTREALNRLLREHSEGAERRMERSCVIGAFVPDRLLETLYVDVPVDRARWSWTRLRIEEVLGLARTFLQTGRLPLANAARGGPHGASPWSPIDIVLPYLEFVTTYLRNERKILEGVTEGGLALTPNERAAVKASLGRIDELDGLLRRAPEALHDIVVQGSERFVDNLILPYVGPGAFVP